MMGDARQGPKCKPRAESVRRATHTQHRCIALGPVCPSGAASLWGTECCPGPRTCRAQVTPGARRHDEGALDEPPREGRNWWEDRGVGRRSRGQDAMFQRGWRRRDQLWTRAAL